MSTQSIKTKGIQELINTSDNIFIKMAERLIIKDEYLPHIKSYCKTDFYHIENLTRLLTIEQCEIKDQREKIKEVLNSFQIKYSKYNQYK